MRCSDTDLEITEKLMKGKRATTRKWKSQWLVNRRVEWMMYVRWWGRRKVEVGSLFPRTKTRGKRYKTRRRRRAQWLGVGVVGFQAVVMLLSSRLGWTTGRLALVLYMVVSYGAWYCSFRGFIARVHFYSYVILYLIKHGSRTEATNYKLANRV